MNKLTNRSTKTELLAAYNAAIKELKALKAGKGAAPKQASAAPATAAAPTVANGEMSIADIIERLRGLTTNIGESASTLQGELTTEATTLTELRQQAEAVIEQLGTLHTIEVTDETLGQLVARYGEARQAADEELTRKREAFDKELSAARADWRKEQDDRTRRTKEAAREHDKARKRDAQEYEYARARDKAQQQDEREQASKRFEQELTELRERKAEEWKAREQALADREKERTELEAKAKAFEGEREAAVKKAEQEGMGIARRQTKTQADLRNKDTEGVRRVFELKIEALEGTIAKQEAQIEALSSQLEGARKQTTELAVKAIDGASNASSFAAIKEIALEQAKNTQKGK
ncbi:MAG: hypothetical protein KDK70_00380 [Myxococcales bacterium]|nr:hypothetical protein [Myxococcales bacterium]